MKNKIDFVFRIEYNRKSESISGDSWNRRKVMMNIISYDNAYRDDMIFMVLQAKDALGRKPRLNEDLLTIEKNYIRCDDGFWLAIDKNDRVIGCIGYTSIRNTTEAFLHRLYVKAEKKHQGIGQV